MAENQVHAITSAGQETIAAAKGPSGLRVAVMERLGEQPTMSVLQNRQVSPPVTTNTISNFKQVKNECIS